MSFMDTEFPSVKRRAEAGDGYAQERLAGAYFCGCAYCTPDNDAAIYWYDRAIASGRKDSYVEKAHMFAGIDEEGYQKALNILIQGSNDYSIGAAATLGDWYSDYRGRSSDPPFWGIPIDYSKAYAYYRRAIEMSTLRLPSNIDPGREHLGRVYAGLARLYWNGWGAQKDQGVALIFALKAFKDCPPAYATHALLEEMFNAGIGGELSSQLAKACRAHDHFMLNEYLLLIEQQYGDINKIQC